jgi:hypothetical protein
MRRRLALAALPLLVLPAAGAAAPAGPPDLDVLIAIDTTGSMTPSIEQAKRDARQVVADTQAAVPGARFAVAEFRDAGDRPAYALVQAMTGDPDRVAGAMQGLFADGGGDSPEAYATVFRRAAADEAVGWRAGARRLLVVIGDAEPHGAGAAGLAGCSDRSADPLGVPVRAALAELRAAEVSLAMILQASSASTTLECYRSIANAAFGQGSARQSGDGTARPEGPVPSAPGGGEDAAAAPAPAPALRTALRAAIAAALPQARVVRRPGGLRVVVTNPTGRAVRVARVRLALPRGVRVTTAPGAVRVAGGLEWRRALILAPGRSVVRRVGLTGPARGARASLSLA